MSIQRSTREQNSLTQAEAQSIYPQVTKLIMDSVIDDHVYPEDGWHGDDKLDANAWTDEDTGEKRIVVYPVVPYTHGEVAGELTTDTGTTLFAGTWLEFHELAYPEVK